MHLRMTWAFDKNNKIESVLPIFSVGSIVASTCAAPDRIMVARYRGRGRVARAAAGVLFGSTTTRFVNTTL
jgi:hypothetical protein